MNRFGFFIKKIRFVFQQLQLPQMGEKCKISPAASFTGYSSLVKLADRVQIRGNAVINCDKEGEISIGKGTVISHGVYLTTSRATCKITIGENCSLNVNCIIYGGLGGLEIGNNVRIAAQAMILPGSKIFQDPSVIIKDQGVTMKGVKIGNDVFIGAGAIILDGVTIGDGVVIGAGSVVAKNVAPYTVMAGPAAGVLRKRETTNG